MSLQVQHVRLASDTSNLPDNASARSGRPAVGRADLVNSSRRDEGDQGQRDDASIVRSAGVAHASHTTSATPSVAGRAIRHGGHVVDGGGHTWIASKSDPGTPRDIGGGGGGGGALHAVFAEGDILSPADNDRGRARKAAMAAKAVAAAEHAALEEEEAQMRLEAQEEERMLAADREYTKRVERESAIAQARAEKNRVEETARLQARADRERAAAQEEHVKRLAQEEQAMRVAQEEQAKRLSQEEQAKRLAQEEQAKRLRDAEETRRAEVAAAKAKGAAEEQRLKAAARARELESAREAESAAAAAAAAASAAEKEKERVSAERARELATVREAEAQAAKVAAAAAAAKAKEEEEERTKSARARELEARASAGLDEYVQRVVARRSIEQSGDPITASSGNDAPLTPMYAASVSSQHATSLLSPKQPEATTPSGEEEYEEEYEEDFEEDLESVVGTEDGLSVHDPSSDGSVRDEQYW